MTSTAAITLTPARQRFLKDLFPTEDCLLTPEETAIFGSDSSRLQANAWAVVRPERREQVVELMTWADRENIPIIPRSRGTNMVGGCVPISGGVVVSMLKMNRIRQIDPVDGVAVVEPGVVTADLQKAVADHGLFYPPDPASVRFSTVGGNVVTNAGGMRAVKYGVTRDYVLGLEVVLPGGEVFTTGGRCRKNVVGLDVTGLLVGSEGTLGIITSIIVKLLALPEASASVLLGYFSSAAAIEAGLSLLSCGITPVALEFMSEEVLQAVSKVTTLPWPDECRAVLLIKLDGDSSGLPATLKRFLIAAQKTNPLFCGHGLGASEEEPLWDVRRLINPASFQVRSDKISEDVTIPRSKVLAYVEGAQRIEREEGVPILTFGHLGDGNIHTNIMFDGLNEKERISAGLAKARVVDLTLQLGGSASGEHGVGLTKLDALAQQIGPSQRSLMRRIKKAFDPKGIMNPGKAY